ncbi:MAG: efflux RND transporter permease subunit [bacterium]|nr:efflux RND transporter permease subunit [bacterium]
MKIYDLAVKRPVTMIMGMLIVLVLGIISFTKIPVDLLPDIQFPVAGVVTVYPGASPAEIESLVTDPIESQLSTVSNLENISSVSNENVSIVVFQFDWDADISESVIELRNKLEMINQQLPEDAQDSTIIQFDPSLIPTLQIGASSNESDVVALTKIIKEDVIPEIERVDGVASISLVGARDEVLAVTLEEEKLQEYALSKQDVTDMMRASDIVIPAGTIEKDDKIIAIRTQYQLSTIDDVRSLPITVNTHELPPTTVALSEIADVQIASEDSSSLYRLNGEAGIGMVISKEGSANTLAVAEDVQTKLDELEGEFSDLDFVVTSSQARLIEQSINTVGFSGIIGGIIAIIILLFFLRNLRSTLIISISIPFSVISTFVLMYYTDLTLNIMTLGGLMLGIGMLVDNSIVVLENIYRHLEEENLSAKQAAIAGAREVAGAITASTITTLVVFLPITFAGGLASQFFTDFALTIAFSLLSSLAIALTVVPALGAMLLRPRSIHEREEKSKHLFRKEYSQMLTWSLNHRVVTLLILAIALVGTGFLYTQLDSELMPSIDKGELSVSVDLPAGTPVDKTAVVVQNIEDVLLDFNDVNTVAATIGSTDDIQSSFTGSGSGENGANMIVALVSRDERIETTDVALKSIDRKLDDIRTENIKIAITKKQTETVDIGSAVEYEISGNDYEEINKIANEFVAELKNIKGLSEVSTNIETTTQQISVNVLPEEALLHGLVPVSIGASIRSANIAEDVGVVEVGDNLLPIQVGYADEYVQSQKNVEELALKTPIGQEVLVEAVSDTSIVNVPTSLRHIDQAPSITVSAYLDGASLGEIQPLISDVIDELEVPTDVEIIEAGAGQMQDDSFNDLGLVLLLAVFLVYMVMAAQFERLLHPLIIMMSFPFSLIGMVIALYVTGTPLSMTALIGVVVLAGIVVNNAIVFVDYAEQLQQKGMNVQEALLTAGKKRLRPIFMTALTTIFALVPLALGLDEGSEMLAPMAIAVIGGLVTSTLLTLLIIPVLYSLLESLVGKIKRSR